MAVYLAFIVNDGIRGLWNGYFFGCLVQAVLVTWMTLRQDWQEIANEAEGRIDNDNLNFE